MPPPTDLRDMMPAFSHAPGPLTATLLLSGPVSIDAATLRAACDEWGIELRIGRVDDDGRTTAYTAQGANVEVRTGNVPLPHDRLSRQLDDARKWWEEANDITTHRATLVVSAGSEVLSGVDLGQLHAELTAAVIDVAFDGDAAILGVLWNGERLYPAEFVQEHARTNPALGLLVGFHVPDHNAQTALYTSGLPVLGLRNIEADATDDVASAAAMVQHMALYLLREGDVIRDGDTVGISEREHIRVREAEATWGGERVLRVRLSEF